MVDKQFYQAAAEEVRNRDIDDALWVKVSAEFPSESERGLQAQYIRLRATELAQQNSQANALHLLRAAPTTPTRWVLAFVAVTVIAAIFMFLVGVFVYPAASWVAFPLWVILMIAVIVLGVARRVLARRVPNG